MTIFLKRLIIRTIKHKEDTTMKNIALATLTLDARHIESLRTHGAEVIGPDGNRTGLTIAFAEKALNDCIRMGCKAITYELFLPQIDEPMMLAVWKDGHVDSGSVRGIFDCLASR